MHRLALEILCIDTCVRPTTLLFHLGMQTALTEDVPLHAQATHGGFQVQPEVPSAGACHSSLLLPLPQRLPLWRPRGGISWSFLPLPAARLSGGRWGLWGAVSQRRWQPRWGRAPAPRPRRSTSCRSVWRCCDRPTRCWACWAGGSITRWATRMGSLLSRVYGRARGEWGRPSSALHARLPSERSRAGRSVCPPLFWAISNRLLPTVAVRLSINTVPSEGWKIRCHFSSPATISHLFW